MGFSEKIISIFKYRDLVSLRMSVVNLNHSSLGLVKAPGVSLLSGAALAAALSFLPT